MTYGKLPTRQQDSFGSGAYLAPRSSSDRKGQKYSYEHNGVDKSCYPLTEIESDIQGVVTKLGYPYGDDLSFRYVQITDKAGFKHRYFYVEPHVVVGQPVSEGEIIGVTQKLNDRYEGITEHCHYEIKDDKHKHYNPETFKEDLKNGKI